MDVDALKSELTKPITEQMLRASTLMRVAYVAKDGTPRVIPIGFWLTDGKIAFATVVNSPKVAALRERPEVAITIDHDGLPPRCLLMRGTATVEIVDGVPDEYVEASKKSMSARGSEDFSGQVRQLYDYMAVITITPTWARMNDFETTLPKPVEEILKTKFGS
ncbi:MAG: pyridoxamine 5'-phosphate oxidase family protein [Nocardiaceae bacterium]|nr:pyridoxamine 5'-phosphate oxidase family protein [Nocardiaceae bacterium]